MTDISKENKEITTINGIIKKAVFQNIENGFTILNIYYGGRFITASGTFFDKPIPDSKIKLKGQFIHHKKYGYQFNFTQYEVSLANTKTAIIDYLSSSIFKGIGRVIAGQIYEKFKEKTLDIIDNEPEKLKEVGGIGRVKLATVLEGLKESYGLRKAIMFFKPYQFSDYQIKSVYNQFKDKSIAVAQENPYLFTEIKGIGFKKADIMAEKLGIKKDDPNRIKEAIKYIIANYCENSGNCYVFYKDIKNGIKDIIEDTSLISEADLKKYISDLIREKKLIVDFDGDVDEKNIDLTFTSDVNALSRIKIYPPVYYFSEIGVSKELKRIAGYALREAGTEAELKEKITNNKNAVSLTEEQKLAVFNALSRKISIISGGPGTGKSTVIKTIVDLYDSKKIALTSLSGKAAQRLSDIINKGNFGENAFSNNKNIDISTIHRLLKAQFDRQTNESFFTFNENNKLPHDLIVVDEMSMVDIIIFYKLLKAVKDGAYLVLVGDVNQIPSVSPGDVLRDLIYSYSDISDTYKTSAFFPSVFLTKVFRQNEGGLINLNAHNLLNNKKFITEKKETGGKEFIIKYKKSYDAVDSGKEELLKDFIGFIGKIADNRMKKKIVNTSAFDDIQVLTPMRKGDLGYNNLNKILQGIFNPLPNYAEGATGIPTTYAAENIFICNGVQFRLYDKVIQKKNNYDLDVFNGDTGYIVNIDHNEKTLSVDFSGSFIEKNTVDNNNAGKNKTVAYDFLDVYENIMHAYALSIHKAQGSEFNNV
ncbi:MAG: ATP-dependent RecD-like DNA helicase, partial [Deltaproteobacteria bacterium]|nr:ATP-dependent RecD-like DNA helicase [Deltaproteobacteria bacterium]